MVSQFSHDDSVREVFESGRLGNVLLLAFGAACGRKLLTGAVTQYGRASSRSCSVMEASERAPLSAAERGAGGRRVIQGASSPLSETCLKRPYITAANSGFGV